MIFWLLDGPTKDLCVVCGLDQNHSCNASAITSLTVMLYPFAPSLATSESLGGNDDFQVALNGNLLDGLVLQQKPALLERGGFSFTAKARFVDPVPRWGRDQELMSSLLYQEIKFKAVV
jgi:hypothetical protein